MCVPWLIHIYVCNVTHPHIYVWLIHICMIHVTHMNMSVNLNISSETHLLYLYEYRITSAAVQPMWIYTSHELNVCGYIWLLLISIKYAIWWRWYVGVWQLSVCGYTRVTNWMSWILLHTDRESVMRYRMTDSYVWHDSFVHVWRDSSICVTWLIHMCDVMRYCMTYSYVWHDSFVHVWRDSSICTTWLIYMCDLTHSCTCDVTHPYVLHYLFTCVTWLIHMSDMPLPHVWRGSYVCHM